MKNIDLKEKFYQENVRQKPTAAMSMAAESIAENGILFYDRESGQPFYDIRIFSEEATFSSELPNERNRLFEELSRKKPESKRPFV